MPRQKSLQSLLKLRRQEMDQLKSRMGLLEAQRVQFEAKLKELDRERAHESALASENLHLQQDYARYAQTNIAQQKQYLQAIRRLEGQMEDLRRMMADQFAEIKKTELLMDLEQQRAKEKEAHHERTTLDELGQRVMDQE